MPVLSTLTTVNTEMPQISSENMLQRSDLPPAPILGGKG